MNPILKNILAFIGALILGMVANGAMVKLGGMLVPEPEGFDNTTMTGMKATFHLLQTKHLLMPFVAHAIGSLVAAFVVTKFAASQHYILAMITGVLFLLAGIFMVYVMPSPMWFNVLDLLVAYLPMAYLGYKLAAPKV